MLCPFPAPYAVREKDSESMDRQRRENELTQALNHPLRLRILEMHKRMKSRSLSVTTVTVVLADSPEYGHVKAAEVEYHRDRLLDAKLLPV
jgi:hypothetical protein